MPASVPKNDHLREWKPVLVEFQNIYYQVLEMQLQLYGSHINIKSFVVPTASST